MNELEIINLLKEWAYRTDYNNGMKGYELSEQELKHVAETIVKKLDICGVVSTCCNNPKEKHGSTAMYEHYKYCGNCGKDLL